MEPNREVVRLGDMRWLWRLTKVSTVLVVALLILLLTGLSDTLVFYARVAKLFKLMPAISPQVPPVVQ